MICDLLILSRKITNHKSYQSVNPWYWFWIVLDGGVLWCNQRFRAKVIKNLVLIPMWFYDLWFVASDSLKITNCDLQFVIRHCLFLGGNTFWHEMALFGTKNHENSTNCKSQITQIYISRTLYLVVLVASHYGSMMHMSVTVGVQPRRRYICIDFNSYSHLVKYLNGPCWTWKLKKGGKLPITRQPAHQLNW